jgi:preprotein translocase subunit SecG
MLVFSSLLIGLVCLLLVVIILAQNAKGGGLVGGMGGATQMMGTRRATEWIEKATWVLSTILLVLCLGLNAYVMSGTSASEEIVPMEELAPADGGEAPAEDAAPAGEGQ